jgi:hypothetical protein
MINNFIDKIDLMPNWTLIAPALVESRSIDWILSFLNAKYCSYPAVECFETLESIIIS